VWIKAAGYKVVGGFMFLPCKINCHTAHTRTELENSGKSNSALKTTKNTANNCV